MAELRAELAEAQGVRDWNAVTHTQLMIDRLGQEMDGRVGLLAIEQMEARRADWAGIEVEVVAEYGDVADELLAAIASAEAAVLAVADVATALTNLVERHRADRRRPEAVSRYGGQMLRSADGTALHAPDPAAVVLSVAAVGLAAGNAARMWPAALDQAQAIRSSLVLPARTTRSTVEETS